MLKVKVYYVYWVSIVFHDGVVKNKRFGSYNNYNVQEKIAKLNEKYCHAIKRMDIHKDEYQQVG